MKKEHTLFIFFILVVLCSHAQTITTVAGTGTGGYNGDNIAATTSEVNVPNGITFDAAGNMYIADGNNNRIREVNAVSGTITTIAGTGVAGYTGDNGLATAAELDTPREVKLDASGNVYITDDKNNCVRKITISSGIITTLAGTGTAGYNGDNMLATLAELDDPNGIALDAAGNIYIADQFNSRVRKITVSTGIITTIAGNGTFGYTGDNGLATAAEISYPLGPNLDAAGNIYFADADNNVIRKITVSTGIITTIAGTGTIGFSGDNGLATLAEFDFPSDVILDESGNIYIADQDNNRIRLITASSGKITTIAGTNSTGYNGDNILATTADLNAPKKLSILVHNLYISDGSNNRIRQIAGLTTLPIQLLSFTGTNEGNNNLLQWQTASETNNNYFTVERSKDGLTYDAIGTVNGAGTSTTLLSYSLTDTHPFADLTYYRLKQTDYNGKFTYSNVIGVYMSGKYNLNIYPNPATATLNLHFTGSFTAQHTTSFSITDVTGRTLYTETLTGNDNSIDISKWNNGIYFYKASNTTETMQGKFVIEK